MKRWTSDLRQVGAKFSIFFGKHLKNEKHRSFDDNVMHGSDVVMEWRSSGEMTKTKNLTTGWGNSSVQAEVILNSSASSDVIKRRAETCRSEGEGAKRNVRKNNNISSLDAEHQTLDADSFHVNYRSSKFKSNRDEKNWLKYVDFESETCESGCDQPEHWGIHQLQDCIHVARIQ